MLMRLINITVSNDKTHKFTANIIDNNNKTHHIQFGAKGYSDYTIHKDLERKKRYILRHQKNENWGSHGILTSWFLVQMDIME